MKSAACNQSISESKFLQRCLSLRKRLDGRQFHDYRSLKVSFGTDFGHCEATIGRTRVLAQTSCEIIKPMGSHPTEGQLHFNVELSSMASQEYDSTRSSKVAVETSRFLERCLKESKPVDLESLCIVADEQVWSLRVDIHILDDNGNILDCACIAGIAALAHFRRPCVTVNGSEVIIHPMEEKPPVPLNVYHIPLCVSFGLSKDNDAVFVDPSKEEELSISGRLVVAANSYAELCFIDIRGVELELHQILQCSKIAAVKAVEINSVIKKALSHDSTVRCPAKVTKVTVGSLPENSSRQPLITQTERNRPSRSRKSQPANTDAIEEMEVDEEPIIIKPQSDQPSLSHPKTVIQIASDDDSNHDDSGSEEDEVSTLAASDLNGSQSTESADTDTKLSKKKKNIREQKKTQIDKQPLSTLELQQQQEKSQTRQQKPKRKKKK